MNFLDRCCQQINRVPQTLKRSFLLYERKAMHNISSMKLYESTALIKDAVEKCLALGFTELIILYPFIEKEIPIFEQIALELIPELRKLYS